jgi:cytochrome P450
MRIGGANVASQQVMPDEISIDEAWVDATMARMFADSASVQDPHPLLAWLREHSPVRVCNGVYFVTRYEDVNGLFRDPRLSRQKAALLEIVAHESDSSDPLARRDHEAQVGTLLNLDDPAHSRLRRILDMAFRPKAVMAWLPLVERITGDLIEAVKGKPSFDLLVELGYPLPERVICELVGVPYADHDLFSAWTNAVVAAAKTAEPTPELIAQVTRAHREFFDYLEALVDERRTSLGDDLVSVLIRAEAEGDKLTQVELLGSLELLIAAGHDTTASFIGNGMWRLITNPDQYERLRADPSLVPNAVEEMLRYETPSHWSTPRVALEDITVAGTVIPQGSLVMMAINSANRDEAVCPHAERFDVGRDNNRHISFGAGAHFCLGAMLARMEARTMIGAIVTRLPRLELVEDPQWKTTFIRALRGLQVHPA